MLDVNYEDYEISSTIIDSIINQMKIKTVEIKTSNCYSFVFISTEKENVYQYFKYSKIALKIFNIINKIQNNNLTTINFYHKNTNIYVSSIYQLLIFNYQKIILVISKNIINK
jgi:hypothetical protein